MATKTIGVEWKRFYADPAAWPEGAWHEEETIMVDGVQRDEDADMDLIPDAAAVTVDGGIVFLKAADTDGPSLEEHFKRWRKVQSTAFFMCEVPREKVDAVKAAVVAAGGKLSTP